ncbi:hypothetical protein BZA70DRAFT_102044 [Myxozyma melibiosi]|uniref:5'-3' DNA helicase ZGRF1-like N-terminal domain-containing protein n=1 Tax=Myxozyma melibiosi TaxID=54550 RepID=A0ABR1EY62_9ASCO
MEDDESVSPINHEILSYDVLWTAQMTQKRKTWNDGIVKLHTFNKRLMLYSSDRTLLDSKYLKRSHLELGETITMDKHIITIEDQNATFIQDVSVVIRQRSLASKNRTGPPPSSSSAAASPAATPARRKAMRLSPPRLKGTPKTSIADIQSFISPGVKNMLLQTRFPLLRTAPTTLSHTSPPKGTLSDTPSLHTPLPSTTKSLLPTRHAPNPTTATIDIQKNTQLPTPLSIKSTTSKLSSTATPTPTPTAKNALTPRTPALSPLRQQGFQLASAPLVNANTASSPEDSRPETAGIIEISTHPRHPEKETPENPYSLPSSSSFSFSSSQLSNTSDHNDTRRPDSEERNKKSAPTKRPLLSLGSRKSKKVHR